MVTVKRVVVVAGIGNGSGTGAAAARLFSKEGYAVALLGRQQDPLSKLAEEIGRAGGEAVAFPLPTYSAQDITKTWTAIKQQFPKPAYAITVGIWNTGYGVFKRFLDVTPGDLEQTVQVNIIAAFAFAREAILTFKENEIEERNGKRGALIFTGATASTRGNVLTSSFAAGKFALRALSQSLNKEFGPENIHVSHAIIDGRITTDRSRENNQGGPELNPDSIANSYLYLVKQDRSAWTWELDLRPSHEKW